VAPYISVYCARHDVSSDSWPPKGIRYASRKRVNLDHRDLTLMNAHLKRAAAATLETVRAGGGGGTG